MYMHIGSEHICTSVWGLKYVDPNSFIFKVNVDKWKFTVYLFIRNTGENNLAILDHDVSEQELASGFCYSAE